MRNKLRISFGVITFVSLLLIGFWQVQLALAQSATNATWTSSITYYTPSNVTGTMAVSFYAVGSGTTIAGPNLTLPPHKAGSLFVGSLNPPAPGFQGTSILSSDVFVVATYVQFVNTGDTGYARQLYTGFATTEVGQLFYIPTVLKSKFGYSSLLSAQNTTGADVTVNLKVYPAGVTVPTINRNVVVPAGSSAVLNTPTDGALPSNFSGSAVYSATGAIVASAEETEDAGRRAYAFEGVASGANTIYMASMLCLAFPPANYKSFYAIQNSSLTTPANVWVDFYNTSGVKVSTMTTTTVGIGNKISVDPCANGVPSGTSGSAVIRSTGAPIIAIGKVVGVNGVSTAFTGSATGATSIAAPYIRWGSPSTSFYRSNVAVMNVGVAPATNISAKYYNGNGVLVNTATLASGGSPLNPLIKVNTNPSTAGALDGSGAFGVTPAGGAVEITSDQPIVVVVRVQKDYSPALTGGTSGTVTGLGEDYNGRPLQ
jgi:hypothetical protein